jgi:hypothetical protein
VPNMARAIRATAYEIRMRSSVFVSAAGGQSKL